MNRRSGVVPVLIICVVTATWVSAQDNAARAAAIADREAAEERYRRLNTAVEGLLAGQVEQQRRIDALTTELRQSRIDNARPQGEYVTQDQLRQLIETVRELDRKREADRRMILEEIDNLGKSFAESLKSATPRRPEPERSAAPTAAYNEIAEHIVEQGQTLSAIVAAYNAEYRKRGKRTSLKLVLEANPSIRPEAMAVGQKVIVPLVPN